LEDIVNQVAKIDDARPAREPRARPSGAVRGGAFTRALTLLVAAGMLAAGLWCLFAPRSFAEAVRFPYAEHFLHDLGAFQFGIGATLALALIWSDGLSLALAGFLIANTIHAVNHAVDLHLGGRASDPWLLGAVSLLILVALLQRLRERGWVVGAVQTAASPAWEPFVLQKTAMLTTWKRDGTPVGTPLSVAVDGQRAFVRSFEKAGKTRRLRNRPEAELAPSTARGRPTGPAFQVGVRRLEGAEARWASRLLARKHPMLHGVLVPLTHRLGRARYGRTVHFELTAAQRS
jgi:PPOX class probable F420-dependent enzyme